MDFITSTNNITKFILFCLSSVVIANLRGITVTILLDCYSLFTVFVFSIYCDKLNYSSKKYLQNLIREKYRNDQPKLESFYEEITPQSQRRDDDEDGDALEDFCLLFVKH